LSLHVADEVSKLEQSNYNNHKYEYFTSNTPENQEHISNSSYTCALQLADSHVTDN